MHIHTKNLIYTIHKIGFCLDKLADNLLQSKFKLTFSQFRVLLAVHNQESASQKDIASFWEMTEAAISRQIEILLVKKWVESIANSENRRQNLLKLTQQGEKQLKQAYFYLEDEYKKLLAGVSNPEKEILQKNLIKILNNLCSDCESFDCEINNNNNNNN